MTYLNTAILENKLAAFYSEYAGRNPGSGTPGVSVTFSSPGLELHFPLSVDGAFVPPAGGDAGPGG